jgi:hypothetical protein
MKHGKMDRQTWPTLFAFTSCNSHEKDAQKCLQWATNYECHCCITYKVGYSEAMHHTYSDCKAGRPIMQECNVVSKGPTVAALFMRGGLTDTVVLFACDHLSLNVAHGKYRIQREQISTASGTEHNSWIASTCGKTYSSLFNNTVSSSDYIALKDWTTVYNKLERMMWKEADMACLMGLS